MEKMRNMIRIKDVPSNTIEEAIIILKENKKVKKYECSNKFKNIDSKDKDNKNYVIKEAELIISDYLKNSDSESNKKLSKKVKVFKALSGILFLLLIVSIIF